MSLAATLNPPRPLSRQAVVRLWATALVLAIAAAVLAATLELNGGKLVYSLDDPYIHLALARHIADFHYGINAGEAAAPASSIAYPVLLALFVPFGLDEVAPLLLNLAALAVSVGLAAAIIGRTIPPGVPVWANVALIVVVSVTVNLVGLVFTGLEHSIHVMLSLAVLAGLIVAMEDRRVPWWLVAALIVGPLFRYEGCAVTVAGMAVLLWQGHWRVAVAAGLAVAVLLAGFSAFLLSLGLAALPSSVLAKSAVAAAGTDLSLSGLAEAVAQALARIPPQGLLIGVLALLIAAAAARAGRRSPQAAIGGFALIVAAGHLVAGRYGWFYRFEIYAFATVLLSALYVYGPALATWAKRSGAVVPAAIATLAVAFIGLPYSRGTLDTPLSANNIYEQQYQMHRFVRDFYPHPVAVNDLGWVAYGNPNYVLDLWGLGWEPARVARFAADAEARAGRPRPPWVETLLAARPAGLAIVYDEWFPGMIPAGWTRVATLTRSRRFITGNASVAFYATQADAVDAIVRALDGFRAALPSEIGLRIEHRSLIR